MPAQPLACTPPTAMVVVTLSKVHMMRTFSASDEGQLLFAWWRRRWLRLLLLLIHSANLVADAMQAPRFVSLLLF